MAYISTLTTEQDDSYQPLDPTTTIDGIPLKTDPSGQLKVRASVLTDENAIRDDYTGVALSADWTQSLTTNGSISVANSLLSIASGTSVGIASVTQETDYAPFTSRFLGVTVSQRIANQTIIFGLTYRVAGVIEQGAYIQLTGTDNTRITLVSKAGVSANDTQSTTVSLPKGYTTASTLYYKIDVSNSTVSFLLATTADENYTLLKQHTLHIPDPYQVLTIEQSIQNTAIVTSTVLAINLAFLNNVNNIQVGNDLSAESMPMSIEKTAADFYNSIAFGLMPNITDYSVNGINTNIGAGVTADVWGNGGTFTQLAAAVTHNIVSTSALDTNAAGTGARKVLVTGLNSSYNIITETVNLNGLTNVLTTNSYLFIISLKVTDAGTLGTNQGNITATSTGGTVAVQAFAPIGRNISNAAIILVPAGYTLYVSSIEMSMTNTNGNASAAFRLSVRKFGELTYIQEEYDLASTGVNSRSIKYDIPRIFNEKDFLKFQCAATTASTKANVKINGTLKQNT